MRKKHWVRIPDKNHISRKSHAEVQYILTPISSIFNCISFSYNRFYYDGSMLMFCGNQHWFDYYWDHDCHFVADGLPYLAFKKIIVDPYIAPESPFFQKVVVPGKTLFNFGHIVLFINFYRTYTELFSFTFDAESHFHYLFANEYQPLVRKFMGYFLSEAQTLIDIHKKNPIAWGVKPGTRVKYSLDKDMLSGKILNQLMAKLVPSRFYLGGSENKYLTQREMDCLKLISEANTAKQIGQHLNISPRSVEKYTNTLKEKLGCANKKALIELSHKIILESQAQKNMISEKFLDQNYDPEQKKIIEKIMGCSLNDIDFFRTQTANSPKKHFLNLD